MPMHIVAWVNLISAAPAKSSLHLQTYPFIMKKQKKRSLKAYDLILPLNSLRAHILRSGENVCNFPSFVMLL